MGILTRQFQATRPVERSAAIEPEVELTTGLEPDVPTIWGLTPVGVHDYFWASRGVRVVRRGDTESSMARAELYLLTTEDVLTTFRLRPLLEELFWVKLDVLYLRITGGANGDYQERLLTRHGDDDEHEEFVAFKRVYGAQTNIPVRAALTRDVELANHWRCAQSDSEAWKGLRGMVRRKRSSVARIRGRIYHRSSLSEQAAFISDMVSSWSDAGVALPRVQSIAGGVLAHDDALVDDGAQFVGNVWIGAGRKLEADEQVVGTAVLWDSPSARPVAPRLFWDDFDPSVYSANRHAAGTTHESSWQRHSSNARAVIKRGFDIAFAIFALLLTLPFYPLIMAAIFIESGRPFFFGHQRETLRGRSFRCWKFRSMRIDAEVMKRALQEFNRADGPQFFLEDDPRLTRVGRFLRKYEIDELPQFWNVLAGDMSVVGPRPSPHIENQYCPAWRDARLRVRPGITGLWQVERTRQGGRDFQEWIKYDLLYVHRGGFKMDVRILLRTVQVVLRLTR